MYYNEFDPFAAKWLRNLMADGLLPEGIVDERSIREVGGVDAATAHFFAGIGGWPLALQLAGWPVDRPVWTGSCPCQPFSTAGKRKGEADERHLWPEFFRLIRQHRPATIFGEQVASPDGLRWLDGVFADLEGTGYTCGAADLCAACLGSPHIRQRLYWVAVADGSVVQRITSAGQQSVDEQDVGPGRLGESFKPGLEGLTQHGGDGHQSGRIEAESGGSVAATGPCFVCGYGFDKDLLGEYGCPNCEGGEFEFHWIDGIGGMADSESDDGGRSFAERQEEGRAVDNGHDPWSDFRIVPCFDNKSRRVGREIQCLAHGLPVKLGPIKPRLEALGANARLARSNRVGRLKGYGNAIVPQLAALFVRAFMETI